MDVMTVSGPIRDQRWVLWSLAGLAAMLWISLVGVIRPSGAAEIAAMVVIAVLVALAVALLIGGSERRAIPVRESRRRKQGRR